MEKWKSRIAGARLRKAAYFRLVRLPTNAQRLCAQNHQRVDFVARAKKILRIIHSVGEIAR